MQDGLSAKIEPSIVVFPPTYVEDTNRFVITITNLSDKMINCEWKNFSTEIEEQETLKTYDLGDPIQRQAAQDASKFISPVFSFEKQHFSIWPKRFLQSLVYFKPASSTSYSSTAYLYVEETKQRIPLNLQGKELAPEASFDATSINVGLVNLDSIFEYKVNLVNIG